MEAKPAEELDMPDQNAISGKLIYTSAAFGGASDLGRDAESRLNDLSGPPGGAPEPRKSEPDENLQQILGGEVPKSTGAQR
ncbi:MAG: hypothetical protein WD627_05555 [Actinomycetota bacterium]